MYKILEHNCFILVKYSKSNEKIQVYSRFHNKFCFFPGVPLMPIWYLTKIYSIKFHIWIYHK